ncbi:hypothetical protein BH20ACT6_BH20ACT6_25200 [soil metagenome]
MTDGRSAVSCQRLGDTSTGSTTGEVVDRALDAYERATFWQETRRALAEQPLDDEGWDSTVRDGLAGD